MRLRLRRLITLPNAHASNFYAQRSLPLRSGFSPAHTGAFSYSTSFYSLMRERAPAALTVVPLGPALTLNSPRALSQIPARPRRGLFGLALHDIVAASPFELFGLSELLYRLPICYDPASSPLFPSTSNRRGSLRSFLFTLLCLERTQPRRRSSCTIFRSFRGFDCFRLGPLQPQDLVAQNLLERIGSTRPPFS